jgi:hypothetical protein
MFQNSKWNSPDPKGATPADIIHPPARLTKEFSRMVDENSLTRPPVMLESPKAVLRDFIIHIDSGSRDPSRFPNRAAFRIDLDESLKNVVCAELLTCVVPNIKGLIAQPYVLLDLGDLNLHRAGVSQTPCFAVLYSAPRVHPNFPFSSTVSPDTNTFDGLIPYDKKMAERAPVTFYPTRPSINHLNIAVRDRLGAVISIGTDADSGELITHADCQWSFSVKFTCAVTPPQDSSRFGT